MSDLFDPFTLKSITLRNRIAVPPMCQYMANDGVINDWHHVHLAGMARGGAALVIAEATSVSPKVALRHGVPGCGMTLKWKRGRRQWRRSRLLGRCLGYRLGMPDARPARIVPGKVMTILIPMIRWRGNPLAHRPSPLVCICQEPPGK